jgi:hypothetical protein
VGFEVLIAVAINNVVNLSEVLLEAAACSALNKGLNYVVTPGAVLVDDILCGIEKAIGALLEETAEEGRQEIVRILKGSRKPKDNMTLAETRALTVLPTAKVNTTVAVDTAHYNRKIADFLVDHTYRKSDSTHCQSIEIKNVRLQKKSSVCKEDCQQHWQQGSRPPRLYGLPKMHNQGALWSTIGNPTYPLANHLEAYWVLILATLHMT